MKALFVMAAGALLLSGIASAAELPSYELLGFRSASINSQSWGRRQMLRSSCPAPRSWSPACRPLPISVRVDAAPRE